ncbi:hypothetical protein GT044_27575 [Streptomyces sp. SID335]|uniref:hypothetical protein n=1 Tax=unclassified Streptomyces TaxID=2593676 RepID=UPI00136F614E|nr:MULTISPECIES: hypothetical protein [unclassified Streptomyces]MYY84970.1 hypothetical protein [Streptomyces sp. SID335]NEB46769.1 hypothetical protein [Streptomyces sp. SID339]
MEDLQRAGAEVGDDQFDRAASSSRGAGRRQAVARGGAFRRDPRGDGDVLGAVPLPVAWFV